MNTLDISLFFKLRRHLKIIHHIPGRLRLRIAATLLSELRNVEEFSNVDTDRLKQIGTSIKGIKGVRINAAAATVIIDYEPEKIEPQWWETLVYGEKSEAMKLIEALINSNLAPVVELVQ